MAMRKWIVGLTVTLAFGSVGVAACGGDDAAGPSDNDASAGDSTNGSDVVQPGTDGSPAQDSGVDGALAAQTTACQAVVDTFCSKLVACGFAQFPPTCAEAHAACPGSIFGDGSSMSVDQATACAAQISAASSCLELVNAFTAPINFYSNPPLRLFPACNVPGTRGPGDSCESSAQCASLYCASPESNWATAVTAGGADGKCGTCAPTFGLTDDCTAGGVPAYMGGFICPIGQVCDATSKLCRTINAGDPCLSNVCAFGATCVANPDGGVGTCAAESATGSPCAAGAYPCAGGGYCVFGDSAHDDGGTCAAIVAPGGKCTPSATATPTCPAGAFCIDTDAGADSYCTALPGDGQPCLGSACAPTTYCDRRVVGKETCRSAVPNGQPCGTYTQTYADGGPTGSTASVTCAGECSTNCTAIPDAGPIGTCVGGMLGGQASDSCGTAVCTTCAPGENCVSAKCAVATLHCE